MKLSYESLKHTDQWEGYTLPKFDIEAVAEKTGEEPTWVHFGAGSIFRAFPAAALQKALDAGAYDRGIVVAEGVDCDIIDKICRPYDNLSLLVLQKAGGQTEKKVIASVTESLKADYPFDWDWKRLCVIFQKPSLQMVSLTITEKGYAVPPGDLDRGLLPGLVMGKVTALLLKRYLAGALPLTVQSMDNCARNGDKAREAVLTYARQWIRDGLAPDGFLDYLQDQGRITFPWSMIGKVPLQPDAQVWEMLAADGFADDDTGGTDTAPFVKAGETERLVLEDKYTWGRPPLELGGVLYADRETLLQYIADR